MYDLNDQFSQLQSIKELVGHLQSMQASIGQSGEGIPTNEVLGLTNGALIVICQQLLWLQMRAMNGDIEAATAEAEKNLRSTLK